MKKLLCLLALSASVAGGSLFAQQGGFVNPARNGERGGFRQTDGGNHRLEISPVSVVKQQADDTYVSVIGFLIEQLDDDKYLLKDAQSGDTIVVEIDADKWLGLVVTPEDQIRIVGKVDKDDGKVEIEAKIIRKFNPAERGAGAKGVRNADGKPGKGKLDKGKSGKGKPDKGKRGNKGGGR